jgi:hypothetical protein
MVKANTLKRIFPGWDVLMDAVIDINVEVNKVSARFHRLMPNFDIHIAVS